MHNKRSSTKIHKYRENQLSQLTIVWNNSKNWYRTPVVKTPMKLGWTFLSFNTQRSTGKSYNGDQHVGVVCIMSSVKKKIICNMKKTDSLIRDGWTPFPFLYRVAPNKVSRKALSTSSPNIERFSKIFHLHVLWKIYNKVIIKYTTTP